LRFRCRIVNLIFKISYAVPRGIVARSIRLLRPCSAPCPACSVARRPDTPQTKPLAVAQGAQGKRRKLRGVLVYANMKRCAVLLHSVSIDRRIVRLGLRSRWRCPLCANEQNSYRLVKTFLWNILEMPGVLEHCHPGYAAALPLREAAASHTRLRGCFRSHGSSTMRRAAHGEAPLPGCECW